MNPNANRDMDINNEQEVDPENIFYRDGDFIIYKNELQELIHSNEHKTKLNLLITKIISKADLDTLTFLIREGYDLDVLNDKGETAIHLAFCQNYCAILQSDKGELLFSCAKDENYENTNGLSLFHIACDLGHLPRVCSYLNKGVDINKRCSLEKDHFYLGGGNLTALNFAVYQRQLQVVKLLLKNGADVDVIGSEGHTNLHYAAVVDEYLWPSSYEQDLEILKIFVKYYPQLVNVKDDEGLTPLLTVHSIQDYGQVSYNKEELTDDLKSTVKETILFDPKVRKLEKVEILLENGADITVQNNEGNTVLHSVINDMNTMRDLLYEPPFCFDDDIHAEVIQKILNSGRNIDVNIQNNDGNTPVKLAIYHMSSKIVKILLNHGADLSHLNFTHEEDSLFFYPKIVPTLECVQNTIAIIDLLTEKELILTPQDNMQFLKVLIHTHDCCSCDELVEFRVYEVPIDEIVSLSTRDHVLFLNKESDWPTKKIKDLQRFWDAVEYGKFSIDEEISDAITNVLEEFDFDPPQVDNSKLEEELARMKGVKLTESKSLYDIMKMNPHNIYQYIVNSDYQFLKDFVFYKNFIKGHIAKSLVRRYVEKSAYQYLAILLSSALEYPCYRMIIQYLSNADIWTVCSAIFPESACQKKSSLISLDSDED